MPSNKKKRGVARKEASALKRAKEKEHMVHFLLYQHLELLFELLRNKKEAEFVHLLTEANAGNSYPINHRLTQSGMTFLFYACNHNLPVAVKAILGCEGIDVNMPVISSDGKVSFTPFDISCQEGHISCVRQLSQAPSIQMKAKDDNEVSPFGIAVINGHTKVVKFFLSGIQDGLIDYNASSGIEDISPFLGAIMRRKKRITKMFLADDRIDHHRTSSLGLNAMDMACIAGSCSLIELIEERGFPPPTNPKVAIMFGQLVQDEGIMTERRALAEDLVLRDHYETCGYCENGYQRKSLKRCCGCLDVFYCSRRCQRRDWKCSHKHNCTKKVLQGPTEWTTIEECFEYWKQSDAVYVPQTQQLDSDDGFEDDDSDVVEVIRSTKKQTSSPRRRRCKGGKGLGKGGAKRYDEVHPNKTVARRNW